MSRIIACKNESGIVMAADGLAVDFDARGNMVRLDSDKIASACLVPRLIGLEVRLTRERRTPTDILPEIRNTLETQAAASDEIGYPFAAGVITAKGFELVPARQ